MNQKRPNRFVKKPWGIEIWMVNTEFYCWKIITCVHEKWSSYGRYHWHEKKDETFYVVSGILLLDIEEHMSFYWPGEKIRVKPYQKHRFRSANQACTFYEISTHHDEEDSIRL